MDHNLTSTVRRPGAWFAPGILIAALAGCHLVFPYEPGNLDAGGQGSTCPQGTISLQIHGSAAGAWTLGLEPGSRYRPLTIIGFNQIHVATIDYDQGGDQVAGFIIARPAAADANAAKINKEHTAHISSLLMNTTPLDPGWTRKTHDGLDSHNSTALSIDLTQATRLSALRNQLVARMLKISPTNIGSLPGDFGAAHKQFILRFTTIVRTNTTVTVVALSSKILEQKAGGRTRLIARDLAAATGLARAGRKLTRTCEKMPPVSPPTPVDIIWVMDESGSMTDDRASIAANAAALFTQATSRGLDFRMGVTNVCNPGGTFKDSVGRFCSYPTTESKHDGGVDRFLRPNELSIFEACILNPPGHEGALEHGLTNAMEAVKKHLPRAAGDPARIRPGARVVIIVVSDEVSAEVTSVIQGGYNTCALHSTIQGNLDKALQPYRAYFSGQADAQAKIDLFQVIAGTCGSTCFAQQPHGYRELAGLFNGTVHDVCEKDLGPSVSRIISSIQLVSGGMIRLTREPVSASLQVTLNGAAVKRSESAGFEHDLYTNALSLSGLPVTKGSVVTVSYQRWE